MDYLLGVHDVSRQGALRFSLEPFTSIFLASHPRVPIPSFVSLSKLMVATERFVADKESEEDLKLLLAPGSSLGGARPKASVRDKNGSLAIAKFSKNDDEYHVVLWEAVALTLAKNSKINVPLWRLEVILKKPVLIIQRFDRKNEQRIAFLSAMSMLGVRDYEQHSYREIGVALLQHGAAPEQDMHELWRRIIFNVMISNTDGYAFGTPFFIQKMLFIVIKRSKIGFIGTKNESKKMIQKQANP